MYLYMYIVGYTHLACIIQECHLSGWVICQNLDSEQMCRVVHYAPPELWCSPVHLWLHYVELHVCILPVYCIRHITSLIFRESGLQDISASGWIRDRGGEQSWTEVGEISIIHSFARALCTVLLVIVYNVYTSCILASRSEVNLFSRVIEFANSTRLVKFAKIKPPWNIWRRPVCSGVWGPYQLVL